MHKIGSLKIIFVQRLLIKEFDNCSGRDSRFLGFHYAKNVIKSVRSPRSRSLRKIYINCPDTNKCQDAKATVHGFKKKKTTKIYRLR